MSKKNSKPTDGPLLHFNHLQRYAIVALTTVSTILVFGLIGWLLDSWLGTKPWFFVILLFISFPITQIQLIKKMKKFTKSEIDKYHQKNPKS